MNAQRLTALPETFGQLTQLQTLHMDNNQLTALPETFGQLRQLQTLYMDNNQLTALPETCGQLRQLQWLHMNSKVLTKSKLRRFLLRLRLTQICKTATDVMMCGRR